MSKKNQIDAVRKIVHDLRANHHAANLNAQAAAMLCKKSNSAEVGKVTKHLAFILADLEKFKNNLDELTTTVKAME